MSNEFLKFSLYFLIDSTANIVNSTTPSDLVVQTPADALK